MQTHIRTNDGVADRLEAVLALDPRVPFGTFGFRISGGEITLFGTVATVDERAAIYEAIDDFPVLKDIDDQLVGGTGMTMPMAA